MAGTQFGVANQHVPRGQENERHGSGIDKGEGIRNRDDVDSWHGDQFAVPSLGVVAEYRELGTEILASAVALLAMTAEQHGRQQHARANFQIGYVFATLRYFASNVASEGVRQLDAGKSFANPQVEVVESAGANADEDVVFAQDWIGDLFVPEDFRSTEFMHANGFHGGLLGRKMSRDRRLLNLLSWRRVRKGPQHCLFDFG